MITGFSLFNLSTISLRDWILKYFGFENNVYMSIVINISLSIIIPYMVLYASGFNKVSPKCNISDFQVLCCNKWHVIELEGDVVKKTRWESYTSFSRSMKSILYYISKLNLEKTTGISHLKEIIHNDQRTWDEPDEEISNSNSQYMVNQSYKFLLKNDIWCSVSNSITEIGDKGEGTRVSYIIKVYSQVLSLEDLSKFLDTCCNDYVNYLNKKNNQQYFLSIKNADDKLIWNKFIFKSNRTFDNMYMVNKDSILSQIEFFIKNKAYYIKRGIPYTLGLLFHGDPGTGKTSFIKALANKLSRHIIEIPLKKIKTCESLYEAFYTQNVTGLSLKFSEKIIVLEDIDAMDDLIKRRSLKVNPTGNEDDSESGGELGKTQVDLSDLFSPFMKSSKVIPKIKDISLSFLLNLIEGILEMDGRIIIMTTNHIDKIDPALIRPGRIDMKIHFKLLSTKDINNMIKFYIPGWEYLKLKNTLKLSQAQLMNIIITCREDLDKIKLKLLELN